MHKLKLILLAAAAAVLSACGGGSDDTLTTPPGGPNAPVVSTLTLLTSSPQIPSDGTQPATITALVRDANNNVMPDVSVIFSSNSGSLVVAQPAATNDDGVLTAQLSTAGDQANRVITVSATAGNASSQVSVNVIGTTLTLTGPSSLPTGSSGAYAVKLVNAANDGINGASVTVTSSRANGISQTPLMTNAQGDASFTLTANNSGSDTVTVSALGIQSNLVVSVSSDAFTFTAPAQNAEIALGAAATITARWTQGGVAAANQNITFSTTRGTLSAPSALTNASGDASVTISANNAGPALITATNSAGTTIQRSIEFVATTPTTLELQANPFTVPTSDQSTLTAIVRDPNGNLVKNQVVTFSLSDITGGFLSVGQSTTDSQGRASTTYNASTTTSAVNGVHVTATVPGSTATDTVDLTVARREVFIIIGSGNELFEPNTAQYRKEWIIQVTDAQGNGVNGVDVTVSVLSERYWDGIRIWDGVVWRTQRGSEALPTAGCPDEDINTRDGVLGPTEDLNGNGRIEAGNILSVAPSGGTGNRVTTNANGFALLDVFYPQEYAYWLEATLQATASVQGTEFAESTTFVPPGLVTDFNKEDTAPPGLASPFGTDGLCSTPPPPDGP
jgi:hypothetical protein